MQAEQSSTPAPRRRRTIALTGATGFVGAHLIDRLLLQGDEVRALARRAMPPRPGVAWVAGDVADANALADLCAGADALIHGAALIKARRPADFFTVNVAGTRMMLEAAQRGGVARVLLLSSLAARAAQLSPYAASKRAAEDVLTEGFSNAFDWSIIRAPAVYGPGDRETLKLFKALRWRIGLLPNVRARVSLIHVGDLCAGLAACLDSPASHGLTLDICDQTPGGHDLADLYRIAAGLLDVRPLLVPVPRGLLTTMGAVNAALARVSGRAAMLTPGKARELAHPDWVTADPHLCRVTDWRPQTNLAAGLAQTLAWYQAQAWL